MLKVSICIPAYRHYNLLRRCLDSILRQSFQDYEIIITDDSPTDELGCLAGMDKRIVYIRNERPLGSPANWNKAISLAKGEYIKIMHQDDWFASPNALLSFVKILDESPNVDFAFSGCCDIGENICVKRYVLNKAINKIKKNPIILYSGNFIGAPSVTLFRNGLNIYFDESLIWLVDIEFYIRFLNMNPNFAVCPDLLINIGISDSQITNTCINNRVLVINEYLYVYNKLFSKNDKKSKWCLLDSLAHYNVYTNAILHSLSLDTVFHLTDIDVVKVRFLKLRQLVLQRLKVLKKNILK